MAGRGWGGGGGGERRGHLEGRLLGRGGGWVGRGGGLYVKSLRCGKQAQKGLDGKLRRTLAKEQGAGQRRT